MRLVRCRTLIAMLETQLVRSSIPSCIHHRVSHMPRHPTTLPPPFSFPTNRRPIFAAIFQLASVLEIVHAALNIVKGSPVSALMQWAGRSNIFFGVVRSVPEVQSTPYVAAMLLAWTISEVIRYPWYAATTAKICPFWLTWLRYTAFIPLYPVGVVGEMGAAWFALPLIKQRRLHSISLPHRWNVSFDYRVFMVGLLCVYPILWWQLYSLLLRQRRKKLGGAPGRRTKEE
jgi:very-long-chain (3R)-3-hydroxyacyl-CoA dehydratase